jgi:hypothetical protein
MKFSVNCDKANARCYGFIWQLQATLSNTLRETIFVWVSGTTGPLKCSSAFVFGSSKNPDHQNL